MNKIKKNKNKELKKYQIIYLKRHYMIKRPRKIRKKEKLF